MLVNPKRFMIATILYLHGPITMGSLQKMLGLSWGDLDRQLRTLRSHGYVETRKVVTRSGPRTIVELTETGRRRYEETLDALEKIIEEAREAKGVT